MNGNVEGILKSKGREVITVESRASVSAVADILTRRRIGAIVVLDPSDPTGIAGIISERDIIRALARHGGTVLYMTVEELMTHEVLTCRPTDSITCLMDLMTNHRVRHLPVVDDNGQMIGIISIGDVVKMRLSEMEAEAHSLRQYIAGSEIAP